MKRTKKEQAIYNAIELQFCRALATTRPEVIDAMNRMPCFLGSEKHFDYTVKAIVKALKAMNSKTKNKSNFKELNGKRK